MEFRILGPLEVRRGPRLVRIGGAKPRSLLALLLLAADRVVSTTDLVDELWGESPPPTAERQLVPGYVHALRKAIGSETVVTQAPGYRLRLDSHVLDLVEFERLTADARGSAPDEAVELYRRALALWRGAPLSDVLFEGAARTELARLRELELACRLDLFDAELALGRHAQLVGELEAQAAAHPFQERLHGQLMLALYRSGRQVEALAAYTEHRRVLYEQLGLQPGQELRELEASILRQDADLDPPGRRKSPTTPTATRDTAPAIPEQRVVSVLVAGLDDPEGLARRLGDERAKFLCDDAARLIRVEVESFGGTVATARNGDVVAVFGAPEAHEDDSKRAVRAALAIRETVADYAGELDVRARVGVDTGPMVVDDAGGLPAALDDGLADTAEAASRLRTLGELVVSGSTARQVAGTFDLVEVDGTDSAFLVSGPRTSEQGHRDPPLVGRGRALSDLALALASLHHGTGAIVAITGEPGIGKSRLVAELEARLADRVRFLTGHAVGYAETIPYWPVRRQLRALLGLVESDSEARVRLELHAELAQTLDEEADRAFPYLATMLGLGPEPGGELDGLAPDAVRQEAFYWLRRLVLALAHRRPLCLVFEDLHWADEATIALVDDLVAVAPHAPVAFLLVLRNDAAQTAAQLVDRVRRRFRRVFVELDVGPLARDEARALAATHAGAELSDRLADLLEERTGGNPYFVGEAVRDLLERGALESRGRKLELAGRAAIPAAVQEALQARLARLDAQSREVVATAAVVGRTFGLPLLERVLPRRALLPTLSELESLQLVVAERTGPEPEYRFRHGLVQEVAYVALLEPRRRELHLRAAEALLELNRDSLAESYGLLAHHFAEADDAERAVEYLLKAGDAARAVYADEEAIALYGRALDFMERTGDEQRARTLLLRIGLAHHVAFDFAAADEAFARAFSLPPPEPERLETTEHLTWAVPAGWPVDELLAPNTTNSHMGEWVARNLMRGLVTIGRELEIEPELAERFTLSADGLLYRFTLRPDLRWNDGVPVTAYDFAFTFNLHAESESKGLPADRLRGVSATAVDERTLELRLRTPRNCFLYELGSPVCFAWPKHVYDRRGADWWKDVPPVGNGPFTLTSRPERADARVRGRLTLEASPSWHGARGNVAEVTVELMPSPPDACERWRDGEFDLIYELVARLGGADEGWKDTTVDRHPAGFTEYLGLDSHRPPLDDVRVRRAVALAIDRHALAPLSGSKPATTSGMLAPGLPGHSPRVGRAHDPESARAILREVRDPEEILLTHFAVQERTATLIEAQLHAVGLRVRRAPVHSNAELKASIDGPAHAYVWAWSYDLPDAGDGFLAPILEWMPKLYRDEQLETLLERAAASRDQDERLGIFREFERIWIGEQAAVVPLAYHDGLLWRRPWLTGLWANTLTTATFASAVVERT